MENGDKIFRQATDRLTRFYFCDIFNKSQKYRDSGLLFEKAAQMYKLSNNLKQAATSYIKAADCNKKIENEYDVIGNYLNAFYCYKKYDHKLAIDCANNIIEICRSQGNLDKIIRIKYELIDLYDDVMDNDRLLIECKECLGLLSINNKPDHYGENMIKIKLADTYIRLANYREAAEIYEKLAFEYLEKKYKLALKYRAFDYIFNSAICYLAFDKIIAERILDTFLENNSEFIITREYECLTKIIIAIKKRDLNLFSNTIYDYNLVKPLMNWQIDVLAYIKEKINEYDLL